MQEHVLEPAQLVCFNLGYLPGPGTDKALTTKVCPCCACLQHPVHQFVFHVESQLFIARGGCG